MIPGEYEEIEIKPIEYVMLTYWRDKKNLRERFHGSDEIMQGFKETM